MQKCKRAHALNEVALKHTTCSREPACMPRPGGGSVTFGAPMVVYATDPVKLYDNLQRLEAYAEQQAGDAHPPLQFHNYVNGLL